MGYGNSALRFAYGTACLERQVGEILLFMWFCVIYLLVLSADNLGKLLWLRLDPANHQAWSGSTLDDTHVVFMNDFLRLPFLKVNLTLNAPITTKVVCFSRLLKCLRNLYGKQCGPRPDCSYRSNLFWVHTVCFYTLFVSNDRQLFATDNFSRRHFQMHFFPGALRVKKTADDNKSLKKYAACKECK